jgi:hypothetical protein
MDVAALSTAASSSAVANSVNIGVLNSVQTLDKIVAAKLFASIGLGATVDSLA